MFKLTTPDGVAARKRTIIEIYGKDIFNTWAAKARKRKSDLSKIQSGGGK